MKWLRFALALLTLTSSTIVAAQEEKPTTTIYTVEKGDTCAAIATRFYGDPRRVDLIHEANEGMGPPPHDLRPGQRLKLPPKSADGAGKPDATLTRVRNQVEVTTTETRAGKPNDPLYRGNRVGTKASSAADVTFRDETQVKLGESSLVIILGDSGARAAPPAGSDVTLVTGSLRTKLSDLAGKKDVPPRVATDAGSVALKSGDAQVTTDEKKTTRVAVYSGSSSITAQKKTVDVADGFGSKAEQGKSPTPPLLLPPAPEWKTPVTSVVLAHDPADVSLVFAPATAPGPAPAEWHVQLARDTSFDDVLVDQRTPLGVTRIEAKALVPGEYFARVSAIDADRFEGKWSALAKTRVARVTLTPLPARRSRLTLDGLAGIACTVDNATASFPLEVDRDHAHVIACAEGTLAIAPLRIGTPRVTVTTVATHARGGTLLFKILDENGEPVSYPPPQVEAPRSLAIEAPRPTGGAGIFVAAFERLGPTTDAELRVHVADDGVALAKVSLERDAGPTTASRSRLELSLAAFGVWQRGLGAGAELELHGTLPIARGESSVLVGVGAGLAALPPSSIEVDTPDGEETARTSATTTSLRPFLGYRIEGRRFSPYITVGPELLRQRVEADLRDGTRRGAEWLFGGSLAVGAELRLGSAAAIFLEARGRATTALETDRPSLPASGVLLLLGGRVTP